MTAARLALALCLVPALAGAAPPQRPLRVARDLTVPQAAPPPPDVPVTIQVDSVPVGELLRVVYRDLLDAPYVSTPAVDADRRAVSLRLVGRRSDVAGRLDGYVRSLGWATRRDDGMVSIEAPQAAPPPPAPRPERRVPFLYRPLHRAPSELLPALLAMVPAAASPVAREVASPVASQAGPGAGALASALGMPSAAPVAYSPAPALSAPSAAPSAGPDVIALEVPARVLPAVRSALARLDVPAPVVSVRAWLYEYSVTRGAPSVMAAASQYVQSATPSLAGFPNNLQLAQAGLTVLLNSLASDSRFRLMDQPTVLARTGMPANLTVGQEVPIQSSVSYAGASGTAVQGIEYKPSGTILTVTPTVRGGATDLQVHMEVSSFEATSTGVSTTPTEDKRSFDSAVSVLDGRAIVVGGLAKRGATLNRSAVPFLGIPLGQGDQADSTDLLLVLQVQRTDSAPAAPTTPHRPDVARALASGLY